MGGDQHAIRERSKSRPPEREPDRDPVPRRRSLVVGPVDDRSEREADGVANQVVQRLITGSDSGVRPTVLPTETRIQRKPVPVVQPGNQQGGNVQPPVVQPVNLDVKGSKWTNEKGSIVGSEKRSSKWSRREAEAKLAQTPEEGAEMIVGALTSGAPALRAWERVAFAMSGHDGKTLKSAYQKASNGRILSADIYSTFSGDPGPKAADYLIDCLAHNGMPSLTARLWVTVGLVDNSGSVARFLAGFPKLGEYIGSPGDDERFEELLERASATERRAAWLDPEIQEYAKGLDSKMVIRIRNLIEVDQAERTLEDAKGGQNEAEAKKNLAIAKDKQLANMLFVFSKGLPLTGKVTSLVTTVSEKVDKNNVITEVDQKWHLYKVESKKFYDYLLSWRSNASDEDLARIRDPKSHFQTMWARVPRNPLMGLTSSERTSIEKIIGSDVTGGEDTQTEFVKKSLERQKGFVDRDGHKGWLKSRIALKVGTKKWRDLETEIKLLSEDQRKKILDEYDIDPAKAMPKLETDLMQAGLDKEDRFSVMSLFNTKFGKSGGAYTDLWVLMNPGKGSKLKENLKHAKPTKWSKAKDARSGKSLGKKALEIMYELEDNEFALVRNDSQLMALIKEHSTEKVWAAILDVMGMKDENDQATGGSTREIVHQAKVDAEVNPKRWAHMIMGALPENTTNKNVSAGRDKAQLYVMATRAQAAARLGAKTKENFDPDQFLLDVLNELDGVHVQYLKARVPEVYKALSENAPIPVEKRMERAKHEGFGIGSKRNVDRQKFHWAFSALSGPELLKDWSNIDEFRGLHTGAQQIEKDLNAALDTVANAPENPTEEQNKQIKAASQKVGPFTEMLAKVHGQMQTFTIGVNEQRRADMKQLGLSAEDRLRYEGMITDKIADALDGDHDVQEMMKDIDLPYDKYMRAKMKGVDALEMQRYLDGTRQWHQFSTKTTQLSEATRNVKGQAVGTESKLRSGREQQLDKSKIEEIRSEGGKGLEQSIEERNLIEARFKDMQATFRQRAMLIFKLITTLIVTAIVTAATFGAGAPLSIGLHIALEALFAGMQVAYQYYVLGDRSKSQLAADFAMSLLNSTVRVLTGNIAVAMNASIMNPMDFAAGTEWMATPISKGLGKIIHGVVMFAPEHLKQKAMQEKDLEKVIKEGEDDISDAATDMLVKQGTGFVKRILVAGVKEGIGETQALVTGEPVQDKPMPKRRGFGEAMTERLNGGENSTGGSNPGVLDPNSDEQGSMWAKYQKEKLKATKKEARKLLKPEDKNEKQALEEQRKDELKDARKEKKTGTLKDLGEAIDADPQVWWRARGDRFLEVLTAAGFRVGDVAALSDNDKGGLEDAMHMNPGQLDRELRLPAHVQLLQMALENYVGMFDQRTIESLVLDGTADSLLLLKLKPWEAKQLAWSLGLDPDEFVRAFRKGLFEKNSTRSRPPNRQPPPVPINTSSKPPNRPPPKRPVRN